ncbi:disease resistance protein [Salix suchowensis]|nr:disease resistance protein [Salix suchowensis]
MAIEGIGGSIVSKITELLVEPVIKQFHYMFCFNNFVQEFDEQMLNMALAFYRLQDAVNVAKRNVAEIEIDVDTWLEVAKNEMEGKTETLRKLEEKIPLQDIGFLPSKEFTRSESSNEAFEQIMKALKVDNVNMIGLYGMGGVGKTTLVKEIGRRAKESQLFDVVLLATVSQNPNVMYMQDRMEDNLDLRFDEKTTEGGANRLWQRLKTKKKLLVILNDVWKVVNLKEIGIPVGDDHRGCLRNEDSNLNTVAKKVARECQGLPIALVTVGRALRGKSVDGWELSYDYLKHEKTKLCFLLCCLFPEDYHIPIEDLTRYTVGYGIHQDVESIEDARKQVYVEIKTLKDCCMLLGTETEEKVKMHDLVRDVAIQIASKEHGFMVKAGIGLKEWPRSNKSFEGCTTIR